LDQELTPLKNSKRGAGRQRGAMRLSGVKSEIEDYSQECQPQVNTEDEWKEIGYGIVGSF